MHKRLLAELPVVYSIEKEYDRIDFDDKIQLSYIEGASRKLPEYFRTEVFSIHFMLCGKIMAEINHQLFVIDSPCGLAIFPNHILRVMEMSEESRMYVLSFSMQVGEDLNLSIGREILSKIYIRPVMSLTEEQLDVCLQYVTLLKKVIEGNDICNAYEVMLGIMRSMICYMTGFYNKLFSEQYTLTRAEEHAGHFLSLVDIHCHAHHTIDWYASEMCLSPQYMANVVKQVTGKSAGDCIVENLVGKAKSLLLTTALPIQEVADRLGFKNQSHFGTFFRRAVGVSPKIFRMRK